MYKIISIFLSGRLFLIMLDKQTLNSNQPFKERPDFIYLQSQYHRYSNLSF
ncbi:hypothetical protein M758_UG212000 [Ceratodon purpureus]|nr:hypothetical protein M758_UG212000 [Ceratodon purpureus]